MIAGGKRVQRLQKQGMNTYEYGTGIGIRSPSLNYAGSPSCSASSSPSSPRGSAGRPADRHVGNAAPKGVRRLRTRLGRVDDTLRWLFETEISRKRREKPQDSIQEQEDDGEESSLAQKLFSAFQTDSCCWRTETRRRGSPPPRHLLASLFGGKIRGKTRSSSVQSLSECQLHIQVREDRSLSSTALHPTPRRWTRSEPNVGDRNRTKPTQNYNQTPR